MRAVLVLVLVRARLITAGQSWRFRAVCGPCECWKKRNTTQTTDVNRFVFVLFAQL